MAVPPNRLSSTDYMMGGLWTTFRNPLMLYERSFSVARFTAAEFSRFARASTGGLPHFVDGLRVIRDSRPG